MKHLPIYSQTLKAEDLINLRYQPFNVSRIKQEVESKEIWSRQKIAHRKKMFEMEQR